MRAQFKAQTEFTFQGLKVYVEAYADVPMVNTGIGKYEWGGVERYQYNAMPDISVGDVQLQVIEAHSVIGVQAYEPKEFEIRYPNISKTIKEHLADPENEFVWIAE